MPFDAFISYSSKDKIAADAACAVLEGAGVRCWIAPRDIRAGGEYGAAIVEAIDQCRVMVLIFSSSANDWVRIHREIERAVSKGVTIVPVRIEEIAPTKSMEYFLGAIHWLDALTAPVEKHFHQLAETVKAILQVDASPRSAPDGAVRQAFVPVADRPAPENETVQTSGETDGAIAEKPKRTAWLIPTLGAGIVAALLAGGGWFYQNHAVGPAAPPSPPQPPPKQAEALVPETVPFISDNERAALRSTYLSAPDHKALAISNRSSFITGQKDDETAKSVALEACKRASGSDAKYCQLYAVGNTVVFTGGRPPLPPEPWVVRDPSIEKPLVAKDIPLILDSQKPWLEKSLPSWRNPKAISITPGNYYFRTAASNTVNTDEAVRRTLEWCGYISGAPCLVVAVDDVFVVPIPATMKATDIFRAGSNTAIAPELRADVARRLVNATSGWNVVAVGSNGRAGLGLRASKEQDGIASALADCNRQDRNCRVIAIGPFSVEPLPPSAPEIVTVDTKAAVAANDRGKAAFAKKDYDQAIVEYTEAIRIDPKYRDAYFNRGTTYHFGKRDYDRAIADYTQAIQLDPKIADSFSARGVAYFDSKQYDLAITDQTEAIRLDPNSRDAYFRRGVVYRNGKRDPTHAVADFTEAIRLDPKVVQSFYLRGQTYLYDLKDTDRAIADYTEAIRLDPKFRDAYFSRGVAYRVWKKDYDRAISDYTEVIRLDPKYVLAFRDRGLAYMSGKQDYDHAIADFTEAIRLDPKLALALYYRGQAKQKKGDTAGGDADIASARALDPNVGK